MKHLKKFNENKTNSFVYKYNHNGKDLFYYVDDVEGDIFVDDINSARVFTEKQIKDYDLDSTFEIGQEYFCPQLDEFITLESKPQLTRLGLNESSDTDSKISMLIKRKLDGENLSEKELLQVHNWMMKNDKEYSNSVDKQLKKDLKKYVPKGTKIK